MSRKRLVILCSVALLTLLGPVSTSLAQTPAAPGVEAAKQLSERARQQYSIGSFREALSLYKQSYQAAPLPVTIFNVAQCHRQLGEQEQALFLYRSYLRQNPQAPNRANVEGLIAELDAQVQRKRAQGAGPTPFDEKQLLPRQDDRAGAITAGQTSTEADEPPRWYRRWYVWVGVAALVAGGVVGGVLGARASGGGPPDPSTTHGTMSFTFGR